MIDSRSENGDSQAAEEDRAPVAGALPLAAQRQAPGLAQRSPESSRLFLGRRVSGC